MLTLKKKYLITKVSWGALYLIIGITKTTSISKINELLGAVMNIFTGLVFIYVIGINLNFYLKSKKIEVEDELAQKNVLKAKSLIYDFIYIGAVLYLVLGSNFNMNIGIAFLLLGAFQIMEYVFFEYYENRGIDEVGSI